METSVTFEVKLTEDERNFLLNLVKRKELKSEYVLQKKGKYDKAAVERAKKTKEICSSILEKLTKSWINIELEDKKKENLEKKVRDLEIKVDQLEVLVKKLAAYHSAEF